ncbi:hypothetical protein FN976_22705 [Caenimonas sedimenti]|uniref:Uncharacterized protein n=1 Tax=Caenimonas sedimenti TaxID=2596921 RepID=A0A562ZJT4_9BURK|nr:hypothetical protein [Caenimonas sedimenti]TWO68444.1 hypothetical protein FN976_22705 [Caenimonas sedimenti]
MALLGQAALAMWWDMAPDVRSDFEDWHSHEHFPERMGIPGFRRGTRWRSASGGGGIFVMYELEAHETLSSAHYLARLNQPTPWSARMMPHHRNMVRSQCRVLASQGTGLAANALTVRLSPAEGRADALHQSLAGLIAALPMRPGLTGAHLLRHEAPAIAVTTEQKIRGGDQFADWVLVVPGYDLHALRNLAEAELSGPSLVGLGAAPSLVHGLYALSHSAVPADVA